MAEPIEIDVWHGEIAELEVDALVVAANESLFMTAGAAASVKRHGGDEIERAAVDQGPIPPGSAIVTAAGSLASASVIHCVAVGHDRIADARILAEAVRAAIRKAGALQLRRIAMALLGTEHGAFSPAEAAAIQVRTVLAEAPSSSIDAVVFASIHPAEVRALGDAVRAAGAEVSAT